MIQKISKVDSVCIGCMKIMKTITLCQVAILCLLLASCEVNTEKHSSRASLSEVSSLIQKNGCNNCHDIDMRVVGPSWIDISMKYRGVTKYAYRGQEYSLEDGLVIKVSQGGSGNWGAMPMPGNDLPGAKQDEIRKLVKFVLGLSN